MSDQKLQRLEGLLGYEFQNKGILRRAITHKSISGDPENNNERLEFLGDAVLQLVISDYLLAILPAAKEGELAKTRAMLVSQPTLADTANRLELGTFLRVGRGEERSGARFRASLLSDAVEALLGAIYLDSGMEAARRVILRLLPPWQRTNWATLDAKTTLQESLQQISPEVPEYHLAAETGPDHDKRFEIEVVFQGRVLGRGCGRTKKEAAQEAARRALVQLNHA